MIRAMLPEPDSSATSSNRRTVLAALGIGACATLGGVFYWRSGALASVKPLAGLLPAPTLQTSPDLPNPVSGTHSSGPVQPMTREWFVPHLHSKFQMHAEVLSSTEVELIEVSPDMSIKDKDHHLDYTSFSLVFKGPLGMPKESQVYSLDHEKLGKMEVFLSPIGRYKDQVRYEAVFSQRV